MVERLEGRSRRWTGSSATAGTSQLVRHARPAPARAGLRLDGRQRQPRGHLIALASACREIARQRPLPHRRRCSPASRDAVDLARETAAALEGERRTQTTDAPSSRRSAGGARVSPTMTAPQSAADVARASAQALAATLRHPGRRRRSDDRGARRRSPTASSAAWTDAVSRTIASHVRDAGLLEAMATLAREDGSSPTLRDLVDGAPRRARTRHAVGADLVRRLIGHRRPAPQALRRDGLRLPLRADAEALLDRLPGAGRHGLDPSCYDLLASEARLASFLAIAKGDVEPQHWFRLGRPLTPVGRGSALISWSGSMFEYLMPLLVMRAPWLSLLDADGRPRRGAARSSTAPSAACRGASPSRPSTRATSTHLPVLELRRARPRAQARPRRGPRRRAVRDRAGGAWSIRRRPSATSRASPRPGRSGRYGFYEALDYTPRRAAGRRAAWPSSTPTWRTTRA